MKTRVTADEYWEQVSAKYMVGMPADVAHSLEEIVKLSYLDGIQEGIERLSETIRRTRHDEVPSTDR